MDRTIASFSRCTALRTNYLQSTLYVSHLTLKNNDNALLLIPCDPRALSYFQAKIREDKADIGSPADTEIDWTTYMQQVALYQAGERDYTAIKGDTGPLVYPAAHVYIYSFLYEITNQGQDILRGQIIFAGIYIATLMVVITCYIRAGAPPYLLPLLVLSKRLHSIYMLRLFNDGVAALAMWLSILLFQSRLLTPAVSVWSFGVGIKMSLLLLAPAVAIIVALTGGIWLAIPLALNAVLVQVRCNSAFINHFLFFPLSLSIFF